MTLAWKPNWEETRRHLTDWWHGEGFVVGAWAGVSAATGRALLPEPGEPDTVEGQHTDVHWRAIHARNELAQKAFPLDSIPTANVDMGPGSLALYLGAQPGFSPRTIYFEPCWGGVEELNALPKLAFDPTNAWWQLTERQFDELDAVNGGDFMVGCMDLVENIDVLASLRGSQQLLLDMIDEPEWVASKVAEITDVWFEAYGRIYERIRVDGGGAWRAFSLWGPGKTAKVQCDASAMFSPDMFAQFVVPELTRQCDWLDYSMFHLDGSDCLCHLDQLLAIPSLDAIEWTPDPKVPPGGDPSWYPLYRKILEAGKSVQVIGARADQVIDLLKAVGTRGVYVLTGLESVAQAERLEQDLRALSPRY